MKNSTRTSPGLSNAWLAVLALVTLAVVSQLHVSQKWSGAIGLTVIVFVVAITQASHSWSRLWFWATASTVLALHLAALYFILNVCLSQSDSVPRMYWIIVGVPEGIVIVLSFEYLNRILNRSSPGEK
jgi:hypothetical protein